MFIASLSGIIFKKKILNKDQLKKAYKKISLPKVESSLYKAVNKNNYEDLTPDGRWELTIKFIIS